MNTAIVETLHLLLSTTLVGLTIASYFYCAINVNNNTLYNFVFRSSIAVDTVILIPLIIFSFFIGTKLVLLHQLSFQIDWIKAVYVFLSIILLLQIILTALKFIMLTKNNCKLHIGFHFFYWLIILGYLLIIRDAVTQQALITL